MNHRQKKKAEKRKRQLVHRALDVVLDINGTGARKKEITGDKPTAFFYFSGHTAEIRISIHTSGWDFDEHSDYDADFYIPGAGLAQQVSRLERETIPCRRCR